MLGHESPVGHVYQRNSHCDIAAEFIRVSGPAFYCCHQATREAVLNRSPDLTDARLHTFHNTTAVYDLLVIALVRRGQFTMLSEVSGLLLYSVCINCLF